MSDLLEFLAARLDEDEAAASGLLGLNWTGGEGHIGLSTAASMHIVRHDPARVLREVAADRALLDRLERAARYRDKVFATEPPRSVSDEMRAVTTMMTLESAVKLRVAIYSDHPDYDPAWAPQQPIRMGIYERGDGSQTGP